MQFTFAERVCIYIKYTEKSIKRVTQILSGFYFNYSYRRIYPNNDFFLFCFLLRGATGIYLFRIYFFQRIYLFNEDLLGLISCISISVHPQSHPPPPSYSSSPSLSLRPHSQEELCGIYFKIYEDLLKNPNKSQKNKSW
jgi:hypothetical protein